MKVTDFTNLLQDPQQVRDRDQTTQLEEVLDAYPYFQAARALYLRGLKNQKSFRYNQALKYTAACTADREVLFDLITSEVFLQNQIADSISGKMPVGDKEIEVEEVEPNKERDTDMIGKDADSPLPRNTGEADKILDPQLFRSKDPAMDESLRRKREKSDELLKLGSPLEFTRNERHSFSQWLQLTNLKKVAPETRVDDPEEETDESNQEARRIGRDKKFKMIDRFISENPKLVPGQAESAKIDIKKSLKLDKKELMTETLARVYLEQGSYKKAIQAYRILSLKYPEKSGFFADQIKAVENLRDNKTDKD